MKARYIFWAIALLGLSACSQETAAPENSSANEINLVFTGGWGDDKPVGKTALQSDGVSVWWTPRDIINAFYGSSYSGKFYSSAAEPQAFTTFSGTLTVFTGTVESDNPASAYWAIYPYSVENTCDGESVTLRLPVKQNGKEGTFDTGLFPAIAKSNSLDLIFYNVAGGVRFTVGQEGINSVSIKSKNGKPLSGKVKVAFDGNGNPCIQKVVEGVDSVVVSAPVGGFIPGKYYFAALLPGTHSSGLTLRLRKDGGKSGVKAINKSITVNRSLFGTLDNVDNGVEFKLNDNAADIINFKDKTLRAKLIAAFDTDGDFELSYAEAAAVTSFGNVFGTTKSYKSFDEFQYFTGITQLPVFDGWSYMTSITIPESVKTFGTGAFRGCESLTGTIKVPDGMTTLPPSLFEGCKNLEFIDIPKSVKFFGTRVFYNCQKITSITIPSGAYYIEESLFFGCSSLKSIVIPDSVKSISKGAFSRSGIESITIPESVTYIGDNAFSRCENLKSVSLPTSITSITDYCFRKCTSLNSITIPESVAVLGLCCFSECSNLTRVTVLSDVPPSISGGELFNGDYNLNLKFYVPAGSLEAYKSKWSKYASMIYAN
ncbi:MAG: leucine-rich repeat domain-containing protein [Bacteroidales bacterium]|nr:leucine-rich repeat domain-containing protein [Bacteroidales bacterium]